MRREICWVKVEITGIYLRPGAKLILKEGPESFREGVFADVPDTTRGLEPPVGSILILRLQIDDERKTARVERWGYKEALERSGGKPLGVLHISRTVPRVYQPDNS